MTSQFDKQHEQLRAIYDKMAKEVNASQFAITEAYNQGLWDMMCAASTLCEQSALSAEQHNARHEAFEDAAQRCRYYLKHQNFGLEEDHYEQGVTVACENLEKIMLEEAEKSVSNAVAPIERRCRWPACESHGLPQCPHACNRDTGEFRSAPSHVAPNTVEEHQERPLNTNGGRDTAHLSASQNVSTARGEAPRVPDASSAPSSIEQQVAGRPRGAYVPLTVEQVDKWRGWLRDGNEDPSDEYLAEANTLCDMAINCLLYGEEIDRMRSVPSATQQDMIEVPRRFLTDFLDGLDFRNGHGTPSFERVLAQALYSEAISRLGTSERKADK